MKKILLAAFMLGAIITSGLMAQNFYSRSSKKLSEKISVLTHQVTAEDWDKAGSEIEDIEKMWSKTEKKWSVLIDHFEIDNIEMSLKRTKKYIESKDKTLSLAELEGLEFMISHIYKKEEFNLSNIF